MVLAEAEPRWQIRSRDALHEGLVGRRSQCDGTRRRHDGRASAGRDFRHSDGFRPIHHEPSPLQGPAHKAEGRRRARLPGLKPSLAQSGWKGRCPAQVRIRSVCSGPGVSADVPKSRRSSAKSGSPSG